MGYYLYPSSVLYPSNDLYPNMYFIGRGLHNVTIVEKYEHSIDVLEIHTHEVTIT